MTPGIPARPSPGPTGEGGKGEDHKCAAQLSPFNARIRGLANLVHGLGLTTDIPENHSSPPLSGGGWV